MHKTLYSFMPVLVLQLNFSQNLTNLEGIDITPSFLLDFLDAIACNLFQFAAIAVGVMFVIYAFLFFMSRGRPTEMSKAKDALLYGIVGGLVIFGVTTIIMSVAALLGENYNVYDLIFCERMM